MSTISLAQPHVWHVAPNGHGFTYPKGDTSLPYNYFYTHWGYKQNGEIKHENPYMRYPLGDDTAYSGADGSINNPWSLEFALSNPPDTMDKLIHQYDGNTIFNRSYDTRTDSVPIIRYSGIPKHPTDTIYFHHLSRWIKPGDIILVHGDSFDWNTRQWSGVKLDYSGYIHTLFKIDGEASLNNVKTMYTSYLSGTSNKPIIVRPYNCITPVINNTDVLKNYFALRDKFNKFHIHKWDSSYSDTNGRHLVHRNDYYINPNYDSTIYYQTNKYIDKQYYSYAALTGKSRADFVKDLHSSEFYDKFFAEAEKQNDPANGCVMSLEIVGNYTWYCGFEIRNDDTIRYCNTGITDFNQFLNYPFATIYKDTTVQRETLPKLRYLDRGAGIIVNGNYNKLIDINIHDMKGSGIRAYGDPKGLEIEGCYSYFNGVNGMDILNHDQSHGHGLNMHNSFIPYGNYGKYPAPRSVNNNIMFSNFISGYKLNGVDGASYHVSLNNNIGFFNGTITWNFENDGTNHPRVHWNTGRNIEDSYEMPSDKNSFVGNQCYHRQYLSRDDTLNALRYTDGLPNHSMQSNNIGSNVVMGQLFSKDIDIKDPITKKDTTLKNVPCHHSNYIIRGNHFVGGSVALSVTNGEILVIAHNVLRGSTSAPPGPGNGNATGIALQLLDRLHCPDTISNLFDVYPFGQGSYCSIDSNAYLETDCIMPPNSTGCNDTVIEINTAYGIEGLRTGQAKGCDSTRFSDKAENIVRFTLDSVKFYQRKWAEHYGDHTINLDTNSTYYECSNGDGEHLNTVEFIRIPHVYDPDRMNLTVWNWDTLNPNSISVQGNNFLYKANSFMTEGSPYRFRNIQYINQDFKWRNGTFNGSKLQLPFVDGDAISQPIGLQTDSNFMIPVRRTGKEFNVYELEYFHYKPFIFYSKYNHTFSLKYYELKNGRLVLAYPNEYWLSGLKYDWQLWDKQQVSGGVMIAHSSGNEFNIDSFNLASPADSNLNISITITNGHCMSKSKNFFVYDTATRIRCTRDTIEIEDSISSMKPVIVKHNGWWDYNNHTWTVYEINDLVLNSTGTHEKRVGRYFDSTIEGAPYLFDFTEAGFIFKAGHSYVVKLTVMDNGGSVADSQTIYIKPLPNIDTVNFIYIPQSGTCKKGNEEKEDTFTQCLSQDTRTINNSTAPTSKLQTLNSVLLGNLPNPFHNSTIIKYSLADVASKVTLRIYDQRGNTLKEYNLPKNSNSIEINCSSFASGTYYCALIIDNKIVDTNAIEIE